MVSDTHRGDSDYKAINDRKPGGSITCPFCQHGVEYDQNGEDLVPTIKPPLRYSRAKIEARAVRFGEVFLNKTDTTPDEWAEFDKGMPGAFRGYQYAEDT